MIQNLDPLILNKLLPEFIKDYEAYKEEPLDVVLLGGGTLITQLPLIPGTSKILGSIYQLYSTDSQTNI